MHFVSLRLLKGIQAYSVSGVVYSELLRTLKLCNAFSEKKYLQNENNRMAVV
jgi:hypothetical protein